MNKAKISQPVPTSDSRTLITDIYISIMFLLFPLFVGFSGYEKVTASKFYFFVAATLIWLIALITVSIVQKNKLPKLQPHHIIALCFMAFVCISAIISPYTRQSLLGAGRYDGLASQALYILIFMGVSFFGRLRMRHFALLGISLGICCLIAVFQLFNINLFGLFPGGYSYYDKHIFYSGEFLGSMGNTNVLSEFICLALPLVFILPVIKGGKSSLWTLPILLAAVFVIVRANVSGGIVALGCCALLGAPIVLSDMDRLRRAFAMLAFCLIPMALAFAFSPDFANREFSFSMNFGAMPLACIVMALVLSAAALLCRKINISTKTLRLSICLVFAVLLACALTFVYFYPFTEGTLYELSCLLHGQVDDSFGSSRILIWRECLAAWLRAPIFGHGPDTVGLVVDIDFSRYVEETGSTLRSSVDNAHNIYLGYLVNTGLAGFVSYSALLVCGCCRWLRRLECREKCILGLGLLCSAVQGFFALGLCLSAPLFWIMLALLLNGQEQPNPVQDTLRS